jgi:hypothetical protein
MSGSRTVWAAAGGGGGGAQVTLIDEYITPGDLALPNTAGGWQLLAGFLVAVPAAAGNLISLSAGFLMAPNNGSKLDLAVVVAGAAVRYASSGGAVPSVDGVPGWYPDVSYRPVPTPWGITVGAGDLEGGNVTFQVACKSTGVGTLFGSANYPFHWSGLKVGA